MQQYLHAICIVLGTAITNYITVVKHTTCRDSSQHMEECIIYGKGQAPRKEETISHMLG